MKSTILFFELVSLFLYSSIFSFKICYLKKHLIKLKSFSHHYDISTKFGTVNIETVTEDDKIHLLEFIKSINSSSISSGSDNPIWQTILYEASILSREDLKVSSLVNNGILNQPSLNEAIISHVANQLGSPLFQATQIRNLFAQIIEKNDTISTCKNKIFLFLKIIFLLLFKLSF